MIKMVLHLNPDDCGYDYPKFFTIPDGINSVTIEINGQYAGGTLGVLLQEVVTEL